MGNVILLILLFLLGLILVTVKLKSGKQRLLLWMGVVVGIPILLILWYKWVVWKSAKDLAAAEQQCNEKTLVDELTLYFSDFKLADFSDSAFTIHRNARGMVLDSGKQVIVVDKKDKEHAWVSYHYTFPFATNDVLEIRIGEKEYVLSDFRLTVLAHGAMLGGPRAHGCMIDSANINGKRTPFGQNMVIRGDDQY